MSELPKVTTTIFSTKSMAQAMADMYNSQMDTTYKHWVVEKYGNQWQIVLEAKEVIVSSTRTVKSLIIAGILILTVKYI